MPPIIEKLDFSPLSVRSLNQRLSQILTTASDLHIGPIRLKTVLAHFDRGPYPTGLTHSWHAHKEIQLQIGISGLFDVGTRAETRLLKPGHIWLVGPGVEHYWTCRQRGVLMGVHIQITGQAVKRLKHLIEETWNDHLLILTQKQHRSDLEDLLSSLDRSDLWWLDRAGMSFKRWVIRLLDDTLPLNQFYRHLPARDPKDDDHAERYYRLACEYMQYNLHRKIRLTDVASNLGISVRHMSRLFQEYSDTTCNDWLIRRRLEKARELLIDHPNLPVKTVAYNCGFSKPAYFSKVFKEHCGVMPGQFQKAPKLD